MKHNRRLKVVLTALAVIALLTLAFLATGGIYRVVNVGGGRTYVVNRLTGNVRMVQGDVITRVKTEAEARRDEAEARQEMAKREAHEKAQRIMDAARAAACLYVGDDATKLFHSVTESDCLAGVAEPVYLASLLEATSRGFWPCQKCLPLSVGKVKVRDTRVLRWRSSGAPVAWVAKKGDSLAVLGGEDSYYAVWLEEPTTGKRVVGWIAQTAVAVGEP